MKIQFYHFTILPYYSTALIISKNFLILSKFNVKEIGSHCVLLLLYLNIVLIWLEDGRSRPKHVVKYNLILIIASCPGVCCVLTAHNVLHSQFCCNATVHGIENRGKKQVHWSVAQTFIFTTVTVVFQQSACLCRVSRYLYKQLAPTHQLRYCQYTLTWSNKDRPT